MTDQELSCFFVRELFTLKSEGTLDSGRKKKIETHLVSCKACKTYYERLEKAKRTILALAGTKPASTMIDYLRAEHRFWVDLIHTMGWKRWPTALKWAVELSLVTAGLILTIHFFPWVGLVRTVQNFRATPVVAITASTPVSEPEVSEATPAPSPAATVALQVAATTEDEEENSQTAGVVPDENDKKMAGYVWRGSLKVDDLTDDVAERVTKAITYLGGTKAGEVELGWHRGEQRYYHFILPEENYEKFLSVLNEEGIVQLNKERHPRVIRPGHMRIIMTIEESQE